MEPTNRLALMANVDFELTRASTTATRRQRLYQYSKSLKRIDIVLALFTTPNHKFSLCFGRRRRVAVLNRKNQSTPEQLEKWMPLIKKYKIIGTYAQTEMGHGTFVRGLETTATYNPETETFVMHSPTLTATKWWPGGLAHTSTHAIIMARLITGGKDYGIHAFLVQIRSLEDHSVLPGIKVGSIGPKMSYDVVDNGFLNFNKVHIPRQNMLMKYSQVSRVGEYSRLKRDSEKLTYISMVATRAFIAFNTARELSKACTIAIRYSAVRRQSKLDESKSELQVLDYKTQQYALLPVLATSYAFWFTAFEITKLYFRVQMEINDGNLSNAQELHATSAGIKAFTTQNAATGVETCRFRCGGHGFSMSSGLPTIYGDHVAPSCTYEGDNIVMLLQTARYLVKCCSRLASGQPVTTPTAAYLTAVAKETACVASSPQDFRNPEILVRAYKHRAARLVLAVSRKLQQNTSKGVSPGDARNICSVELVRAAQAHCHQFVVEQFANVIQNESFSATLRPVMEAMFRLYCVHGIVEQAKDFLEDGYMNGEQVNMANDVLMELLDEIRPNAIGLVDAFDYSDYCLNSVLGRYDGNVYEHLMKWAEKFPLNKNEVMPAYEKYLRPLLKGEFASKL
ncbi:peroxisomal acyl-coenzyme A oxidase 1 isoform X2, partial [Paramuricea clavata]